MLVYCSMSEAGRGGGTWPVDRNSRTSAWVAYFPGTHSSISSQLSWSSMSCHVFCGVTNTINSSPISPINAQNSQQQHQCFPVSLSAHMYPPRTTSHTHNPSVFSKPSASHNYTSTKHLQYPTPHPPESSAAPRAKIFLKRFDAVWSVSLRLIGARRQEVTLTSSCFFFSLFSFFLLLVVIRSRTGLQVL